MNYDWPGNVRELENTIERALVLGTTDVILLDDLPESLLETAPSATVSGTRYHDAVVEAKKKIIVQAMAESTGNYTEAAKVLGVHVNYLHRLIKNLDLKERLNRQDL
jgi:Nif-specific regulatory protein